MRRRLTSPPDHRPRRTHCCVSVSAGLATCLIALTPFNAAPGETDDSNLPAYSFNDQLSEFGEVPDGWIQIGRLKTNRQVIERSNIIVDGDFTLQITLSAVPSQQSSFRLGLTGAGTGLDLSFSGMKQYTWSDNETWTFMTPAGLTTRGLPTGTHTLILRRKGDLLTLSADSVHRPDRNSSRIAVFADQDWSRFDAIRIETDGPGMQLEEIRLNTEAGDAERAKDNSVDL